MLAKRRMAAIMLNSVALSAYDHGAATTNDVVVIDRPQTVVRTARVTPLPAPTVTPSPIATIAASAIGPNPRLDRQAFRSPPLPPELANDSVLIPLPPRPPASAFGKGEHH